MLLAAEGIELEFTADALAEMTRVAEEVNRTLDNIGARRLHAVLERVVEEVSFSAPELVAAARTKEQEHQQASGQQAAQPPIAVGQQPAAPVGSGTVEPAQGAQPAAAVTAAVMGATSKGKGKKGAYTGPKVKYFIDKAHVDRTLSSLLQKQDLSRYIL